MIQRSSQAAKLRTQTVWRTQSVAALGLALCAGGLSAVACSADDARNPDVLPDEGGDDSSADDGQTPDDGQMPGDGEPGGGSPGDDGAGNAADGEGQDEDLPLADGEPDAPGGAGDPGAGDPGNDEPGDPGNDEPGDPPGEGLAPNCSPAEGGVPNLTLTQVAGGLNDPLFITQAPGDDERLFVLEKSGTIRVILNGELQQQPFLEIGNQINDGGERGLLGLAFHPSYPQNGLFYVHYSNGQSDGVVSEFSVSENDPNVADGASERQLLNVDQPEQNHNGGMIEFNPIDGLLYLGFGDGGGGNDQHGPIGNGQALDTLLGKLLRIDVDGRDANGAYGIPDGNLSAATGQQALPEIWAYGLRNPWRFSFDQCNGDLYVGDVGQNAQEEIDFLPADAAAGANFGWRIMEGSACRPGGDANCDQNGLVMPVDTYGRQVGTSITGGFVYRGSNIPGLRGYYLYADYNSANFFRFRIENGQATDRAQINFNGVDDISSFGRDNGGEVYVTAFDPGAVFRIDAQ